MKNEFNAYFVTSPTSFSCYKVIVNGIDIKFEYLKEENFELSSKMIGRLISLEEDGYRNLKLLLPILDDDQINYLYGKNNKKQRIFNKLRLALF